MAERLRVLRGGTCPASAKSLELHRRIGSSNMTAEQKAQAPRRKIKRGDWCDDLLPEIVDYLIKKGAVVRVQVEEEASKVLKRDTRFKVHGGEKVSIAAPIKNREK